MGSADGIPIEEAPLWVLAILTVVFWLVVFPALVGLLNGFELVTGGGWGVAAAAGAISLLLVVGLARQKRWERPNPRHPSTVKAPPFVRLSTWFFTALMVPNVLYGVLVLSHHGEGLDYAGAWIIGLIASAIHGAFAVADRLRRRQ
jgi:hypothetical protein